MNLEQFDEKFGHLKDVDKIEVDPLCDHPQHTNKQKTIGRGAARRNILKHGGKEFICRDCDMKYNNPMNKAGQGRRQSDEEISVQCPDCQKTRKMKSACYYGEMKEPYLQVCGTCAQKGKEISEEQREKIRSKLKGIERSEEFKQKISHYMKNNPEGIDRATKNLLENHCTTGFLGKHHSEQTKQIVSEKMLGRTYDETHRANISEGRKKMLEAQGGLLPETKEKLSKATLAQYKNGFEPKMHHRRGKYYSEKLGKEIWYKSSYELKAFMILDADDNVSTYEYEPIAIEYYKPGTNYKSNYLIDLKVVYVDGRVELIEVKPLKRTYGELEQAKTAAAISYADEQGWNFDIWTEEKLFNSEKEMREFIEQLQS